MTIPEVPPLKSGRWWLRSLGVFTVSMYLGASRYAIKAVVQEVYISSLGLIRNYIVGPLLSVYQVVRHGNSRLKIIGKEGAEAEFRSLESMVLKYADKG